MSPSAKTTIHFSVPRQSGHATLVSLYTLSPAYTASPILYFGDIFTRFIGNMADQKLAKKYGIEEGILVKKDPNAKGLLGTFNKHFPHEINHGEMIPKVDHDTNLKQDAKLAHANMTISKILLHSLTVFATRIFINKETKSFAKSHA